MNNKKTTPVQDINQFDKALFDDIALEYARKDSMPSSSYARYYQINASLKPLLKSGKSLGTIVDIGCGIGHIATYLKGKYDQYIGIDHSEKMISFAKDFNPKENVMFYSGDVGSTDFIIKSADIVFARGFLHHVDDIDKVMTGLRQIAKPGAYFIAIEPNNGNALIQLVRKIGKRSIHNIHTSSVTSLETNSVNF